MRVAAEQNNGLKRDMFGVAIPSRPSRDEGMQINSVRTELIAENHSLQFVAV